MAKRLAVEWDARELRIVAGTVRGDTVTISDVASTPLETSDPAALGEKLRELLAQHGLEKLSAAIALGRGKAELRELKLPPVPEEELPEMVRFQAVRSFAAAGERAVIDFLPTRRDEEGNRVIAAAVAPEELKNCAVVGAPSQLAVEHIVLGPLAAAALYRRSGRELSGETVLVDLLADDADIVILRDGSPVFVRSIRLADDPQVRVRTLSGEIRRSLMACQEGQGARTGQSAGAGQVAGAGQGTRTDQVVSEGTGEATRRIVLWGRADVHREEVSGLSSSLGTPVETLDPFSLVSLASSLSGRLPEHVGRLAPLVGLLDAEARGGGELIDFLNPRRAPEPVSHRGRQIAFAAAAAGLLGLVLFFGWSRMKALDDEIASQEAALAALANDEEAADEAMARTAKVDAFLDGDVFWLDELRRVATKMPPSENAIAESFSARVGRNGGGTLVITGGVTDSETISRFEAALRDSSHRVVGKGLGQVSESAPYLWEFSETIEIDPESVRTARQAAAAKSASNEPTETEAASNEPAENEPTETEAASNEPAENEPAETEPAETETSKSETTEPAANPPSSADDAAAPTTLQAEDVQ
ncbi:hypothetical protein [Candidatus Laterigemmans baculatus]|uniref:hypothetical protein n=1 Tax=Candidatus Laterigemmans baculatus TaxID=2770505 RepID=UPI0013DB9AAE|nr:hypothetical protein [Candidatus Laterigemmans baculatus]